MPELMAGLALCLMFGALIALLCMLIVEVERIRAVKAFVLATFIVATGTSIVYLVFHLAV